MSSSIDSGVGHARDVVSTLQMQVEVRRNKGKERKRIQQRKAEERRGEREKRRKGRGREKRRRIGREQGREQKRRKGRGREQGKGTIYPILQM